jgi:hypothetical protein
VTGIARADEMTEGWTSQDDYLILFGESERVAAENRYGFATLLPGFRLLGLRGWDDFIVEDTAGRIYCIPTVPAQREHLEIYAASELETSLKPDSRFAGKIKWYVKPIAFGGDPDIETNLIWVDHEQHAQLVRWWNDLDNALKGRKA